MYPRRLPELIEHESLAGYDLAILENTDTGDGARRIGLRYVSPQRDEIDNSGSDNLENSDAP